MTATLAVLSALTFLPGAPACQGGQPLHSALPTPQSAPQRWAQQALANGHLRPWERQWATRMARGECGRPAKAWVSNYGPWEGYAGAEWHIAANPRYLPTGTVVWMDGRLKVVTNRGASRNDAWAHRSGCEFWIDRWTAKRRGDNAAQRVWIVGR